MNTTGGSVYSSSGTKRLDGITVPNLGEHRNGEEYLYIPMSKTLCFVAFSLKLVDLAKISPKLTTKQFVSGLTDLYLPSYKTYRPA